MRRILILAAFACLWVGCSASTPNKAPVVQRDIQVDRNCCEMDRIHGNRVFRRKRGMEQESEGFE